MVGEDGLEILDSDLAATPGEQLHGPVRADERIRNRGSEEVLDLMPEFDEMSGVRQYSFFRVHHSDIVWGNLQVNHFAILVRNHHVAREGSLCSEAPGKGAIQRDGIVDTPNQTPVRNA